MHTLDLKRSVGFYGAEMGEEVVKQNKSTGLHQVTEPRRQQTYLEMSMCTEHKSSQRSHAQISN